VSPPGAQSAFLVVEGPVMPDAAQDSGSLFRLIYRSRSRIPSAERRKHLGDLFTEARSKNKRLSVSGALLVSGEWFVQVLEGDAETVRALFATIEQDSRHDSVTLLETQPVAARVFARWAMAEVGDGGSADIPLIAHADGISPAAGRRTTAEQEALLDVMRNAVRPAPQAV
jgi:hypothetical protein